jgi:hypothetical protein
MPEPNGFDPPVFTLDDRPPSRHLAPPFALGLELPARPQTPPEVEDLFEQTWSHSLAENLTGSPNVPIKNRRKKNRKDYLTEKEYRPVTVNAWESNTRKIPVSRGGRPSSGATRKQLTQIYGSGTKPSTGRLGKIEKGGNPATLPGFKYNPR